jgi:hypothetical protein
VALQRSAEPIDLMMLMDADLVEPEGMTDDERRVDELFGL